MDEREDLALRALQTGVNIAETAGAKGEGMMVGAASKPPFRSFLDNGCYGMFSTSVSRCGLHKRVIRQSLARHLVEMAAVQIPNRAEPE